MPIEIPEDKITEREELCFELGLSLASRILRDEGNEDAWEFLMTFMITKLPPLLDGPRLKLAKKIQQELINHSPQIWKKQS